jgi:hypothetical protein
MTEQRQISRWFRKCQWDTWQGEKVHYKQLTTLTKPLLPHQPHQILHYTASKCSLTNPLHLKTTPDPLLKEWIQKIQYEKGIRGYASVYEMTSVHTGVIGWMGWIDLNEGRFVRLLNGDWYFRWDGMVVCEFGMGWVGWLGGWDERGFGGLAMFGKKRVWGWKTNGPVVTC